MLSKYKLKRLREDGHSTVADMLEYLCNRITKLEQSPTSKDSLMPCPFCGDKNIDEVKDGNYHYCRCSDCNCQTDGWLKDYDAIDAWNRRA